MQERTVLEIVRHSGFLDPDWYRATYPDVELSGLDPVVHFVRYGARLGRDPGPGFDTRDYVLGKFGPGDNGRNPLLHCLEHRQREWVRARTWPRNPAEANPTGIPDPAELALVAPHFDPDFYRSSGVEIPQGQNPLAHFMTAGWRLALAPNDWFDMMGYAALHRWLFLAGTNPFVSFLAEGNSNGATSNPFFEDRFRRLADLMRPGPVEYGPITRVLEHDTPAIEVPAFPRGIVVHMHAFYLELLPDAAVMLARLPAPFRLLVSIPESETPERVRGYLAAQLPRATEVLVRAVPNRGRDVAPWLVHFRDEVIGSELFCHVHTKRSVHADDHRHWLRFLSHSLFGSEGVAGQVLQLFAADPGLGLVAPGYMPMLRRQPNFGQTRPVFHALMERIGAREPWDVCPDYPAGSFFWCRTRLLAPLFDARLTLEDFPEELGQICGTLGHAVERAVGALPRETGLRAAFVTVDRAQELAEQRPCEVALAPEELITDPARAPTVSVIVPTWNRREALMRALASVFAQSLPPLEVIVVDDGSRDGTVRALRRAFRPEIRAGRLKVHARRHAGVSAARNAGLAAARGEIVAYLDSDNTWRPDHLAHLATAFDRHPAALSAYADFLVHDPALDRLELFERPYDRAQLLDRNFIDLNVFAHRRVLAEEGLRFDEGLKRLVDWDFILRATARMAPLHVRYLGADYYLDDARLGNITLTVPLRENMARVRAKHRRERVFHREAPMSFAIKCPAPARDAARGWGDLHFATSLCAALERLGCRTRIDLLDAWEKEEGPADDVVLVLRGLSRYHPRPQHVNLMWHISHPDKIAPGELQGYDHVFVASHSETQRLHRSLGKKASVLLQCADPELFRPETREDVPAHELLFVGNSRGVDRWIPKACAERGLPVAVYGRDWHGRLPEEVLCGEQIRNDRLAAYYAGAKVVLSDHWPDMARRGFISNRIFDAGLAGAFVLSDDFAGKEIFFGSVVTCRDADELEEQAQFFLADAGSRRAMAAQLRQIVALSHTFDHRAREILRVARALFSFRQGLGTGVPRLNTDIAPPPFAAASARRR